MIGTIKKISNFSLSFRKHKVILHNYVLSIIYSHSSPYEALLRLYNRLPISPHIS